ncbi:50S ribosomal protein L22 [bacterium (Candidatus Howlettbacteria) CG_4_10_14_0_8_um_filter_40_9]|nr:MAG: 50S ribosomal protein L22 [bacterium (Candidatus Howlettbacteria) CG_4_10_14_0_8_um_filter_40_9]
MEVRAQIKYIKISPLKARTAVGVIKGKNAMSAYQMLKHMPQKSAGVLAKVLTSAMANAENNHNLDREALTVKEAYVDNGPSFKRIQPRARGLAFGILRKTSHITIVVSGEKESRKIKKAVPVEEEKKIETPVEQKAQKVETQKVAEVKEKEVVTEKAETAKVEEKKTLKDLAKDRVKKETGEKKTVKEEGFKGDKKSSDHEKGGFWNKYFRRKTG